ncbi:MAG: SDR family oxidoreductase [Deltaproteobacteria bacterium]|nr:SDR family oxidoreductase [Deltaproteobacteria bacterium]
MALDVLNSSKILITGATGFIGRQLCDRLMSEGRQVRRAARDTSQIEDASVVGDIGRETSWRKALAGVDTVVHLAARVNISQEKSAKPLAEFRKVNTEGTLALARQATQASVKRFVYISSIGVNGNQNTQPFNEQDTPSPAEPYAVSKLEAEQGLHELAVETNMEMVIIRPPLVYGFNATGSFGSLVRWIKKGIPLPLGAIHNRRNLVGLDNLVDFMVTCIDHPDAANHTFLVADGEDLSTTDLLRRVGRALDKPVRLVPVPLGLLKLGAALLGKQAMVQKLCGSLQVDISKAREVLGWTPPVSVDEGLRIAAGKN